MKTLSMTLRLCVAASFVLLAGGLLLQSSSVIRAGLAILILTPLVRLLALLGHFTRERDRTFAAISIGVLFLVGASLFLALR